MVCATTSRQDPCCSRRPGSPVAGMSARRSVRPIASSSASWWCSPQCAVRRQPVVSRLMPVDLVTTLPARWYTDPDVWERERRPIFGSTWVHIAYEHQLRRPGDYVAENLAGWPIFVRRNDDRSLAGFYNLCPHRAGPIVWDGEGHQANMVCRYHGWAFRDTGRLLNARDFGADVPDDMDLQMSQVESWR